MSDKIKINLRIAETYYPLLVNPKEEQVAREAAKQVNIRINTYRNHFPKQKTEEIVAMVAYEFSREVLKLKEVNETAPYKEKIEELTGLLEDYFKNE